jgi:hypothetical protein
MRREFRDYLTRENVVFVLFVAGCLFLVAHSMVTS